MCVIQFLFFFSSIVLYYFYYSSSLSNLTLTLRFWRSGFKRNSTACFLFLPGCKLLPLKLRKSGNSFCAILKNSSSSSGVRFPRTLSDVSFLKTKSLLRSESLWMLLWPMSIISMVKGRHFSIFDKEFNLFVAKRTSFKSEHFDKSGIQKSWPLEQLNFVKFGRVWNIFLGSSLIGLWDKTIVSREEGRVAVGGNRVKLLLLRMRAFKDAKAVKESQGSSLNSLKLALSTKGWKD